MGPRWTRSEIVKWICSQLDGKMRLLIGLDFAFGFPFEGKDVGYLGSRARQVDRKRRTELHASKQLRHDPETVYKLIGSKQVGKG